VNLTQVFSGGVRYYSDYLSEQQLLFVAVPCLVDEQPIIALLDTGSQWCILPAETAAVLGYAGLAVPSETRFSTRFGILSGRLERIPIRFPAQEGEAVEVEATWFLSEDWMGPPVIGWKGCLERLRFALDPSEEWFYFAEL
jgi:hypothetical protein